MTKPHERAAVFAFGVLFVIVMLVIAIWIPNPTPTQYETFKVVLAVAVAGIAAFIPGFLEVNVPNLLRAGGAVAVFVLIYMETPAQIVATTARRPQITWHAHGRVIDKREFPIAYAIVEVDDDSNARARTNQDGTFDLDVHAWQASHILFRVQPPGRSEFTKLIDVGATSFELKEP